MPADVLPLRRLNRTLLRRQLLLSPSSMGVAGALAHLGGLQAQLPSNPYLALRARLAGFVPADLEALLVAGGAVRIVLMRGTIHLVTTDDAFSIRPVIRPVLERELFRNRTWATGIAGVDLPPLIAFARARIEEQPRSLAELRALLTAAGFRDDPALAYAARNLLPTFQPLPRGLWTRTGLARLAALDTWAGRPMPDDADPAPLLRRYLAAFGPATVADMQAWSALQGLRASVEPMRPTLVTYRDEAGRELFDLPDAPLADGDEPAPVRFLADYDNALLSHEDRSRIIPPLRWPERGDNVTAPVFLVDGFVAGTWKLGSPAVRGEPAPLTVTPMVPLAPADEAAVLDEAASLAAFLATADPGRPVPRVVLARMPA